MKKILVFILRRLWRVGYYVLFLFFLILLLISFDFYTDSSPSLFYASRLRPQNRSAYEFVKFRNLSILINTCENQTTIECLNYLHNNQSDYFEPLSSDEFDFFQNEYCTEKKKMVFHTFWNDPQKLDDPLLLLHIQSHLYTQNRQCSYLIIWTLPLFYGDIDSKYNIHAPYLQFRTLMPFAKELREVGVDIDSYWSWLTGGPPLHEMAAVSDAVRFVVLHKLGGIYMDADFLLLRDLQPFYTHEFAYRWSTLDEFNTAILRLYPQSDISTILIDMAQQNQSTSIFYPTLIRSSIYPLTLNRLPCVFFDPLWLAADDKDRKTAKIWKFKNNTRHTLESVFRNQSELSRQGRTVLNGAFTLHWHKLHKAGMFEQGSFMYQWSEFLNSQLYDEIYDF